MTREILLCGTPLAETEVRKLRAGKLEAHFDAGALRWIRWDGNEVLRAIMFLVRTPGWGTAAASLTDLAIEVSNERFVVAYKARYGNAGAGLAVDIRMEGDAEGRLVSEAAIRAEAPFDTNRTGFVILHPIDGFAGTRVDVEHASASPRAVEIPLAISPGQPVMDMRSIIHRPTEGFAVETRFAGDIFEMEDHRNWSDASFKTYSRPIGLPYPYKLTPGAPISQEVTVTVAGAIDGGGIAPAMAVPEVAGQRLPAFALPLDRLADAETALAHVDVITDIGASLLLLRLDATREAADGDFMPLAELVEKTGAALELQVILAGSSDGDAERELRELASRLGAAGLTVARVAAFAKIDEQSFQPGEERPPHPSEEAIAASLGRHFPQSVHIGGTPAFFTEFNRKRPDPELWKGLTFATTPMVHAADDASVMETLQALPHILGSATALAGGLPLSVGPTGIGARLNPYGAAPIDNAPDAREEMAARDPRQRGLYAAAWTVGYLARIAPFEPERFAFGAPTGPFGLVSTPQDYPRALWDDLPEGALYPLYHVARWIAGAAGGELLEAATEGGVSRLVWRKDGRIAALVANLTPDPQPMPHVPLPQPSASVLDASSVERHSAGVPSAGDAAGALPERLDAYAVVHIKEGGDE